MVNGLIVRATLVSAILRSVAASTSPDPMAVAQEFRDVWVAAFKSGDNERLKLHLSQIFVGSSWQPAAAKLLAHAT